MEFYSWQKDFITKAEGQRNIILSAPTGAGKTRMAYLWANIKEAIRDRSHRVFYTVPIKALANEKYHELTSIFGEENIGIVTGDVTINSKAPVVLCTQEVFLKAFMKERAKVVVDEFHYIFADQGRSRAYIDSSRCKSDMFILSATLGDPHELANYLRRISGKDFFVYTTDFRPTKLEFTEKVFSFDDLPQKGVLIYIFNISAAQSIARIIAERRRPQIARLIKMKRLANKYSVNTDSISYAASGVAVYHGRLQYNEKLYLEECVRKGLIEVLISTNALGVGVNLPIEWVLFAGVRIPDEDGGARLITKTEFVQMAGRAGRPGYYETGYVGCLRHSQNPYEGGESIEEGYMTLLRKELEPPVIQLPPDIEGIVKGVKTVSDEIDYIAKFSLPPRTSEELEILQEKLTEIQGMVTALPAHVKEILYDTYVPELQVDKNIQLASRLASNTVIGVYELYDYVQGITNYQRLLTTYRVAKKLRRIPYIHIPDYEQLVDRIKKIDPFVLLKQEQKEESVLI